MKREQLGKGQDFIGKEQDRRDYFVSIYQLVSAVLSLVIMTCGCSGIQQSELADVIK